MLLDVELAFARTVVHSEMTKAFHNVVVIVSHDNISIFRAGSHVFLAATSISPVVLPLLLRLDNSLYGNSDLVQWN